MCNRGYISNPFVPKWAVRMRATCLPTRTTIAKPQKQSMLWGFKICTPQTRTAPRRQDDGMHTRSLFMRVDPSIQIDLGRTDHLLTVPFDTSQCIHVLRVSNCRTVSHSRCSSSEPHRFFSKTRQCDVLITPHDTANSVSKTFKITKRMNTHFDLLCLD